jgi:hypothetical protein
MDCANCRQTMREHTCEGFYAKRVTIDVCHSCCAIWFDNQELLQMTPASTLQLLADLADDQAGARQPMAPRLSCPRCQRRLVETHDQQHNVKFWYHRCSGGHGKFVTYFQFLRAKNVVRPLADAEIEELRRHVRQINCANCGAPVDVEKGGICGFCKSPLAILDADQLKKIAAEVKKGQEKAAAGIDPTLPLALAMERTRTERAFAALEAEDQTRLDIFGLLHETRDPVLSALKGLSRLLR